MQRLEELRGVDDAAGAALAVYDVDELGLDRLDRAVLTALTKSFGGGPVGIETIAAALSELRDAIEDIVEPYLLQQGFIQRTPRGRLLTAHAFRHLGLAVPSTYQGAQSTLFDEPDA